MIYRRAYLRELCGDSLREALATPFPFELDGKQWDVATNGHAMLLVRSDGDPAWPARANCPDIRGALPKKYPPPRSVNLGRLRDWCASTPPCEDCEGTGWIDRIDVEPEDYDDGGPDDVVACPVCERGYKRGFSPLFEAYIQRALLWRYLRPLSQPATVLVSIAGERDAVLIAHPDDEWRVYCMPALKTSGDADEEPFT